MKLFLAACFAVGLLLVLWLMFEFRCRKLHTFVIANVCNLHLVHICNFLQISFLCSSFFQTF
jgi:hypothetical protein